MNLFTIGISHHTASVEVREKMWLSGEEARAALAQMKDRFFTECVLVSTCNRTEVYGLLPRDRTLDDRELKKFLIGFKKASPDVQPDHFVSLSAGNAVHQLFRVASGIDSMVIGDIQILNQVKEAFALARDVGALGPVTDRLMQVALRVGKRVRTETSICEGAVSVSYAAVELASKIFSDLATKAVLLVGAGETGELTMKHLVGKGIGSVRIANRTREKAEALAASLGGSVAEFDDLAGAARMVDIVVTSVASPAHILRAEDLQKVMRQRANLPLIIIDIGVPRNVDPAARRIDNVFLYDIDSLQTIVDRNLERRKAEIPQVNAVIREEMVEFFNWQNSLQVGPAIRELREAFEAVRSQEVERNLHRFRKEDREALDLVTRQLVNKLLHTPMTVLRESAEAGNGQSETTRRVQILRELFGIGEGPKGEGHE
jgi:glutamyl-tRNA reductase